MGGGAPLYSPIHYYHFGTLDSEATSTYLWILPLPGRVFEIAKVLHYNVIDEKNPPTGGYLELLKGN